MTRPVRVVPRVPAVPSALCGSFLQFHPQNHIEICASICVIDMSNGFSEMRMRCPTPYMIVSSAEVQEKCGKDSHHMHIVGKRYFQPVELHGAYAEHT